MGRHSRPDEGFRLLFVCTGNICRSPFAEILTRHLLIGRLGGRMASAFEVDSAGVQAVAGSGMHPDSRAQLSPWGLDGPAAERFVARQLRSAMVESAHLILGATPRHRSSVVERSAAGLPMTFSIREFARLVDMVDVGKLPTDPVARAHMLVDQARKHRGLAPATTPDADRIPDPMGRSPQAHHDSAMLIWESVQTIVDTISPALRTANR